MVETVFGGSWNTCWSFDVPLWYRSCVMFANMSTCLNNVGRIDSTSFIVSPARFCKIRFRSVPEAQFPMDKSCAQICFTLPDGSTWLLLTTFDWSDENEAGRCVGTSVCSLFETVGQILHAQTSPKYKTRCHHWLQRSVYANKVYVGPCVCMNILLTAREIQSKLVQVVTVDLVWFYVFFLICIIIFVWNIWNWCRSRLKSVNRFENNSVGLLLRLILSCLFFFEPAFEVFYRSV
jgi:hypothetical protein